MSHDSSTTWLKKPNNIGTLRRPLALQLATANNNSLHSEAACNTKPPPRKSCIMYMDRKNMVPAEKPKPKGQLTMRKSILPVSNSNPSGLQVNSRRSMAPVSRLVPRRKAAIDTLLPQWAQEKVRIASTPGHSSRTGATPIRKTKTGSTPLHMSTPCDVVRSILKPQRRSMGSSKAAKKVNFGHDSDRSEIGVAPLEESAIHSFLPQHDVAIEMESKTVVNTKRVMQVHVATNTDFPPLEEVDKNSFIYQHCARKMNAFIVGITDILSDMREFQRQVYPLKVGITTPALHAKLEEIQEMSENITPSLSGEVPSLDTVTPHLDKICDQDNVNADQLMPLKESASFDMHLVKVAEPSKDQIIEEGTIVECQPNASFEVSVDKFYLSPSIRPHKRSRIDGDSLKMSVSTEESEPHHKSCSPSNETSDAEVEITELPEKENIGPSNDRRASECTRRSARLRGHASPAAPLMKRKLKKYKKKIISRFSVEDIN